MSLRHVELELVLVPCFNVQIYPFYMYLQSMSAIYKSLLNLDRDQAETATRLPIAPRVDAPGTPSRSSFPPQAPRHSTSKPETPSRSPVTTPQKPPATAAAAQ